MLHITLAKKRLFLGQIKNTHGSHSAAQTKDEVQRRLLLDVVVRKRAAVLELLAGEDQTLLVRRDALLVLDLGLHVLDRVVALDLKGDCLTSQGLYEDLH